MRAPSVSSPPARLGWVAAAAVAFLLPDSLLPSSGVYAQAPPTIEIQALIRDFQERTEPGGHPDFERNNGLNLGGLTEGALAWSLDSNRNPVFVGGTKFDKTGGTYTQYKDSAGREICWRIYDPALGDTPGVLDPNRPSAFTNAGNFNEWYRDVPGVNLSTVITLTMVLQADGTYVFDDKTDPTYSSKGGFFPIDGQLFGNSAANSSHNFHFTTEIHCKFVYDALAGQIFKFTGDDDVWVYINGELVIDLGGTHGSRAQFLEVNRLGLAHGEIYTISLFHAERQTNSSNFRFQTNLILEDALYTASISNPCD